MPDDNRVQDEALYREFLQEALEHLATLEQRLLELEGAEPGAEEPVATLFRAMHSVKGGAAFLGLEASVKIAHAAETLLSGIREGRLLPTPERIDALLQATDCLREMLNNPSRAPDAAVARELRRLTPDDPAPDGPAPDADAPPAVPSLTDGTESATEPHADDEEPTHEEAVHLLHYHFDAMRELTGLGPAEILGDLRGLGTIRSVRFDDGAWTAFAPDATPGTAGSAEVLLQSPLPADDICTATLLPADAVRPAPPDAPASDAGEPAEAEGAPPASEPDRAARPVPVKNSDTTTELSSATRSGSDASGQDDAAARLPAAAGASAGSIRINVELMDTIMALAGELVLVRNQQLALLENADARVRDTARRLDAVTTQIQESIMLTRMQPIGNLFDKLPRVVRDIARTLGKEIHLELHGRDVELDKIILEGLSDPLTHIIRNACDHGVEPPPDRAAAGKPVTGRVTVRAFQEGGQISIEVRDDGRGVDPDRIRAKALAQELRTAAELEAMSDKEALGLILLPGFSTAESVSDISGRGVGMDVVKACVESIGGDVEITSAPGRGTRVLLRLPLTLAIIPGLVVCAGGERFVIPQASLEELVAIKPGGRPDRVELAHDQEVVRLRDRLLPVARLGEILERPRRFDARTRAAIAAAHADDGSQTGAATLHVAVVRTSGERYGLVVDEVLGTEEIVVKPLHGALRRMRCFSGCTILGDGRVAFILDVDGAREHADIRFTRLAEAGAEAAKEEDGAVQSVDGEEIHDVILFRYGPSEQFGVPLSMVKRIETIDAADIQRVGDREFVVRDGVSIYVLGLDRVLDVSAPDPRPESMFLLMPKYLRQPVGFLVTEIVDTVESRILFREDSYREDGLLGSMSLRDRLTLFPDIFRATEKAEPEWLGEWRRRTPPPGRRRVLLVEDADFFRHVVRRYLEDGGFEVETAVNGRDGLVRLNDHDYDIVISDLMMPEMDGWSFAEEVRRRARERQLPMLALSGLQDERDQTRAFQSGFDRYVPKFDREAFLGAVVELLQESADGGRPGGRP